MIWRPFCIFFPSFFLLFSLRLFPPFSLLSLRFPSLLFFLNRNPWVADLLLCGAENAVSRRDLMALTGYKDRELRLLIEAERRQGIPILSDCVGGYFLPASEAERQQCVRSLRRRAKEIEATAAAIERAEV